MRMRLPSRAAASSAVRSSAASFAIDTPMLEPESSGLTTQGSFACAMTASISMPSLSTSIHAGVLTPSGATTRLVRSLSMAMALPR